MEAITAHVGPAGLVVLTEIRPDGTAGVVWLVPPDEWHRREWGVEFSDFVADKQRRDNVRLFP